MHTERERERVKRQWINRKQQDMFRGSNHCSTSPPSHRRIFTISSTQDFPHREPPLRIQANITRSTQLLSQTIQPLHKRQDTTTIISHQRDQALSQTTINLTLQGLGSKSTLQPQSPLHLEGYQIQPSQSTLTRGITTIQRRFITLGDHKDHKQILSHKTRS